MVSRRTARWVVMGSVPDQPIEVELASGGDAAVLRVQGDVDLMVASALQQQAMEWMNRTSRLIIDLSAITFMDSSGMKVLVDLSHAARSKGRELALRPPKRLGGRRVVDVLGVPGLPWVE